MQPSRLLRPMLAIGLGLLVSACDDESGWPAPTSISGTAAIGAPVVGGTVTLKCRGGTTYTVTTGTSGNYTQNVPRADLPCAMRLSGGTANGSANTQTLHSVSQNGGTANITPLTDLITALSVNTAAGQTLAAWFANPSNLSQVSTGLAAAQSTLQSALTAAGYTVPSPFNPLTTPFSPTAGDTYDDLLEAIATAISNSGTYADYPALLTAFVSGGGNSLPAASGTDDDDEDPEGPSNIDLLIAYAGTYTVSGTATGNTSLRGTGNRDHVRGSITIQADGGIDFDSGISFSASQIVAIYDRRDVSTDKRLAVNYGASDSNERIRLYFDANGTGAANITEIIHDNGSGTTTRAAIGEDDSGEPEEPVDPGSELLANRNGIAFVYGGHTWKLDRRVEVERFAVPSGSGKRNLNALNTNEERTAYLDSTAFEGGTVYSAELNLDPTVTTGTVACDAANNVWFKIVSNMSGTITEEERTWTATSCSLQIDYMTTRGGIGGRILSATLYNPFKNKSITIAGGQFRVYQHRGTSGTAPSPLTGDTWTSVNITNGNFELPADRYFLLNRTAVANIGSSFSAGGRVHDGTILFDGNAEDNLVWAVQNSFFSTTGSYTCGTRYTGGSTNYMNMRLRMGTYLNQQEFLSSGTGGSCTITITEKSGTLVKGSYTATLVSADNAGNKVSISGEFRNFTTAPINTSNNGDEGALGTGNGGNMSITDGNVLFTSGQRFRMPALSNYTDNSSGIELRFDVLNDNDDAELRRLDKGFNLNIRHLPQATGTYACGTAYSGKYPQIYLYTEQDQDFTAVRYQSSDQSYVLKSGASCSVTITTLTSTLIEGSYTATLTDENAAGILSDGDGTIGIAGSFRHVIAAP